jgi:hypothetical protein
MSLNFLLPFMADRKISDNMPGIVPRVAIAGGLGTFSSLLGIGGGTIAIMVMTLCGRSIHRAIATASGIGTLIAIPSAIGFAIIGFGEAGCPGARWASSTCLPLSPSPRCRSFRRPGVWPPRTACRPARCARSLAFI